MANVLQKQEFSSAVGGVLRSRLGELDGSISCGRSNTFTGAPCSRKERREVGDRRSGQLKSGGSSALRRRPSRGGCV